MSSTGKARSPIDRLKYISAMQKDISILYNQKRTSGTPQSISNPPAALQSPVNTASYLPTAGGAMIGPIAFNPTVAIISGSTIDISSNTNAFSSKVILGAGGGANLATITGAHDDGQILVLEAASAVTKTIKNSGNIITWDGNDFVLASGATTLLVFDGTSLANKWVQITTGGGGGGGGVSYPLIPTIHAWGNQGGGTTTMDMSASDAHVQTLTLTGNQTFAFSNPPAAGHNEQFSIEVTQNNVGGWVITWPVTVNNAAGIVQGTSANQRTVYVVQTSDNGTSFDVFNTDMAATISSLNFADKALDNLTTTSINQSLIPSNDNVRDIGTNTLRWGTVYGYYFGFDNNNEIDAQNATGFQYNIAAGKTHQFNVNSVGIISITNTGLMPVSDVTFDIGSTTKRFNTIYSFQYSAGTTNKLIDLTPVAGISYGTPTGKAHLFKVNNVAIIDVDSTGLIPDVDVTSNLGSSSKRFNTTYSFQYSAGTTNKLIDLTPAGGITYGTPTGKNHAFQVNAVSIIDIDSTGLIPDVDVTSNLGTTAKRFNTVYSFQYSAGTTNKLIDLTPAAGITYGVPTGKTHDFQVNAVSIATISNTVISPTTDLTLDIGSTTKRFNTVYSGQLSFGTTNRLIDLAPAGGTHYNVETGKIHEFYTNAVSEVKIDAGNTELLLHNDINTLHIIDSNSVNAYFFKAAFNGLQISVDNSENILFGLNGVTVAQFTHDTTIAGDTGYLELVQNTYTSASAGTHGAVPAQVSGYAIIRVNGTRRKIPFFDV